MARRSDHSQEEIKKMVLEAAEAIVVEEGFAELKVRKVAMEIGYTVGSIYMVFENMADLILHVKGRTLDDISAQLLPKSNKEAPADENIEMLATTYFNFARENYNRWNMIFDHHLADDDVPEWYQQKVDEIFGLVEAQFKRLLTDHSEEQSKMAARTLWSGVHGICTLSLTGKLDIVGVDNIENAVILLVDNFIKGWKQA